MRCVEDPKLFRPRAKHKQVGGGAKYPNTNQNDKLKKILPAFIAMLVVLSAIPLFLSDSGVTDAAEGDAGSDFVWNKSFGDNSNDVFNNVIEASDGFVAVGSSSAFGNGDWTDVTGKGGSDAIIVKFNTDGTVAWKYNFGGNGSDYFRGATEVSDGFVAVGYSNLESFGNGDWSDVTGKGGSDAIIVKFNTDGTVAWKYNFGGSGSDNFNSVTEAGNGYVAVGNFPAASFGTGDWSGIAGKGGEDAIIVKFDTNGNVLWKKNFGGSGSDSFNSVTEAGNEYVAVGISSAFGDGDWSDYTGNGIYDAIIVKFSTDGNVVWKNNFGGSGNDYFNGLTGVSGGFVAVGYSTEMSFGTGDWSSIPGKGRDDAIIVKFNNDGTVAWKNNFGGNGSNTFYDDAFGNVTEIGGGYIAVGNSNGFGTGDWSDVTGKGGNDAILVRFNTDGSIAWKYNFGGSGDDAFNDATEVSGGFVAVGYSIEISFGTGDWSDVTGKGGNDAILVKFPLYDVTYHTNGGSGGPADDTVMQGTTHTLNSTMVPTHSDMDGKKVVFVGWSHVQNPSIIDQNGTLPQIVPSIEMERVDVTVYAVWAYDTNDNGQPDVTETSYGIIYDVNGGTGGLGTVQGFIPGTYTLNDTAIPARAGYEFMGWSFVQTSDVGKDDQIPETTMYVTITTEDIIVYAVWKTDSATVAYHGNGGTGPAAASGYTGGQYTLPSVSQYTRQGYVLAGWSSSDDGTSDYAPGSVQTFAYGVTDMYAVWLGDTMTVTYRGNGGTGPSNASGHTGEAWTLPSAADYVRAGYVLAGWDTSPSASTVVYAAGSEQTFVYGITDVYAVWDADSEEVVYQGNGGNDIWSGSTPFIIAGIAAAIIAVIALVIAGKIKLPGRGGKNGL